STVLVAGATGFVGRALVPALLDRGHRVRACSRHPSGAESPNLEHVRCDLADASTLSGAFAGVDEAYYLVHSLGKGARFGDLDRRAAKNFVAAAASAGL